MKPIKRGGSWRIQVRVTGHPSESGTFPAKRNAELWAFKRISEPRAEKSGTSNHTLSEAIERLLRAAINHAATGKNIVLRLNAVKHFLPLNLNLEDLKPSRFADFRDLRSQSVKLTTVQKELNYLSAMMNKSIKEWDWLKINPISPISRPAATPHRDRIITDDEIQKILISLGENGTKPTTISQ